MKLNGWAVESRVYAEDPFRNFLPSIGRLVRYRPPPEGVGRACTVRNDTGVFEGGEISMFYDPDDRQAGDPRAHARGGDRRCRPTRSMPSTSTASSTTSPSSPP